MWGRNKAIVFIETMLDAGYLILDYKEYPQLGYRNIQHPGTSIQDHEILPMTFAVTT
jgi:hypothetical protein